MKHLLFSTLTTLFLLSLNSTTMHAHAHSETVRTLPFYNSAEFTPHWLDPQSDEAKNFHRISDFSLLNQSGERVTNDTFQDQVYVAHFFFTTCPGICPTMRSNIFKVQDHFEQNQQVGLISYSIQPEIDTVEALQDYAAKYDVIDDKWHLVTGERSEIYSLANKDYFANEDMGEYMEKQDFLHTENLVLIDKNRHIRGVYNGLNKNSINYLIKDINTLLSESSSAD